MPKGKVSLKKVKKEMKKAAASLEYNGREVITNIGTYKGKHTLQFLDANRAEDLGEDEKFKAMILGFGVRKAQLILEAIDEIKDFVEEYAEEAEDKE